MQWVVSEKLKKSVIPISLDVGNDRLLTAIQPGEVGALAVGDPVVAAREVSPVALYFNHPGAGIRKARRTERRRHRLLQADDQKALKRPGHY